MIENIPPNLVKARKTYYERCHQYPNPWGLTTKEYETLKEIACGSTFLEAAEIMGVTRHTIDTQIKAVRRKMKVETTSQAAYLLGCYETRIQIKGELEAKLQTIYSGV